MELKALMQEKLYKMSRAIQSNNIMNNKRQTADYLNR